MSTAQVPVVSTRSYRAANVALWVLQVLLAVAFLMAGASKLAGAEMMVANFEKIGIGQWFRYLTGGLEVAAGALLFFPRLAGYAALLLVGIMIGAAATHVFIFKDNPAAPLVFLVLLVIVAWRRLAQPHTGAKLAG